MKSIHKSKQFIYRFAINVFLKQVYSMAVHMYVYKLANGDAAVDTGLACRVCIRQDSVYYIGESKFFRPCRPNEHSHKHIIKFVGQDQEQD